MSGKSQINDFSKIFMNKSMIIIIYTFNEKA